MPASMPQILVLGMGRRSVIQQDGGPPGALLWASYRKCQVKS